LRREKWHHHLFPLNETEGQRGGDKTIRVLCDGFHSTVLKRESKEGRRSALYLLPRNEKEGGEKENKKREENLQV